MAARSQRRLGRALALALVGALSALAPGCVTNDQGDAVFDPLSMLMPEISVEQERLVGNQADSQIRAQLAERGLLIDDPYVVGWINELAQSMVQHFGEQKFPYRIRVIREKSLNAFALPGGYIYFHSGTILEANQMDELVGVMAHEIAHSRRHHWARGVRDNAIPQLVSTLVGAGLSVATGEAAPLLVAQGVNESLRLAYTRELESEADQVGTAFMVRAGYDPMGMAIFFERLVAKQGRPGFALPPYLFSHPRAEVRAEDAVARAETTTIAGQEDPRIRAGFREAQLRLGLLVAKERSTLLPELPTPDRGLVAAALSAAGDIADPDQAIGILSEAEAQEPFDPRLPFRQAELLEEAGRLDDAVAAYSRTLALDPTRALVHFRLGRGYRSLEQNARAIFHLEQAQSRFVRPGPLTRETERLLKRLTFPVFIDSGVADPEASGEADSPVGRTTEAFPADAAILGWWGRVDPAWVDERKDLEIRWLDPIGEIIHQAGAKEAAKAHAVSRWKRGDAPALRAGIWQVEAWLDEERVGRTTFKVTPAEAAPARN